MHTNSKLLFQKHVLGLFHPGLHVLEIGPDANPSSYRAMVRCENVVWHTLDISGATWLDYRQVSPYSFPIQDACYDIVLSGQVIEHVPKPWRWMPELARVAKPGGFVVTIAPASWPYHEAPVDCWRLYPEALKALSDDAGLVVETVLWGTLESPHRSRAIPGRSAEFQPWATRIAASLLWPLGMRVEKAYDSVCIARKP